MKFQSPLPLLKLNTEICVSLPPCLTPAIRFSEHLLLIKACRAWLRHLGKCGFVVFFSERPWICKQIPVSVKTTLRLRQPFRCNPAEEAALQPPILCFERQCFFASSSVEECFFHRHR